VGRGEDDGLLVGLPLDEGDALCCATLTGSFPVDPAFVVATVPTSTEAATINPNLCPNLIPRHTP
jgi:hypothetical protein